MLRNSLLILLISYIILSFLFNINLVGFPLHTFIILVSVVLTLPLLQKYTREISNNYNYIYLKYFLLFFITFCTILITHDLISGNNKGIIKSISILVYLLYLLPLLYIFNNIRNILIIKKLLIIFFYLFSISFLLTYNGEEIISVFNFTTRTNLAWFLILIYLISFDYNKKNELFMTTLLFLVLIINSSKAPIIALLIILFFNYRYLIKKTKGIIVVFIFLLIVTIIYLNNTDIFNLTIERFVNIFNLDYGSSTGYRMSVIVDGFISAKDYFFGQGINSFSDIFYYSSKLDLSTKIGEYTADNSFIELLFDAGWIPIFLLLLFIYKLFKMDSKSKTLSIIILLYMLVDTIIYNNFILFILLLSFSINIKQVEFLEYQKKAEIK